MKKATKKEIKLELRKQMGNGQRMITGAEFRFGISRDMSREDFDAAIIAGNDLILSALDKADELGVRL